MLQPLSLDIPRYILLPPLLPPPLLPPPLLLPPPPRFGDCPETKASLPQGYILSRLVKLRNRDSSSVRPVSPYSDDFLPIPPRSTKKCLARINTTTGQRRLPIEFSGVDPYRSIVEASTTVCRSRPESASAESLSDAVPPRDHAALGHNITILAGRTKTTLIAQLAARSYKWCTMEPFQLGTPSSRFSQNTHSR
jgi:hypothetical protein